MFVMLTVAHRVKQFPILHVPFVSLSCPQESVT